MSSSSIDGNSSSATQAQIAAREAEQNAINREADANKRLKETEDNLAQTVQHVRDEYEKQRNYEISRNEEALQNERAQGYDRIVDQKKRFLQELKQTQDSADQSKLEVKDHADREIETFASDARKRTQEEQVRGKIELDKTKKENQFTLESEKARHLELVRQMYQQQQSQAKNLTDQGKLQFEKNQAAFQESQTASAAHFEESHQALDRFHQQVLSEINTQASNQIAQTRGETAQKLSAYSSRQQDPFYKMVDSGALITETAESYVVHVPVPSHEQENVTVIPRGNEISISGHRRNEEKLEFAPGRLKESAAFQSFTETFPIEWPVDPKQMVRQYDGSNVVVTIPKKGTIKTTSIEKQLREKIKPQAAQKPDFPKNLPVNPEYHADTAVPPPKGGSVAGKPLGQS